MGAISALVSDSRRSVSLWWCRVTRLSWELIGGRGFVADDATNAATFGQLGSFLGTRWNGRFLTLGDELRRSALRPPVAL